MALTISWKWWFDDPSTDKGLAIRVLATVVIVLLLWAASYVFVELFPVRLWVIAQTFRLCFIVSWLGFLLLAGTCARILKGGKSLSGSCSMWIVLMGTTNMAQPLLALWGHIVEIVRRKLKSRTPQVIETIVLGLSLLVAAIVLARHGNRRESLALFLLLSISFWLAFGPRRWYRLLLPLVLVASLVSAVALNRCYRVPLLSRFVDKIAHATITLSDHAEEALDETAQYARENTEEHVIFVTPPRFGRFRLIARKAIVVDHKAFPLQDWAMAEWKRRITDCYGEVAESGPFWPKVYKMDEYYRQITNERVLSVAKKYGASYAVLYADTQSDFPVVFNNESYKIVRLPARLK